MKKIYTLLLIAFSLAVGVTCASDSPSVLEGVVKRVSRLPSEGSFYDKRKLNQPFEALPPYKETGLTKVNSTKKHWVRRVGDKTAGLLLWTPDEMYAVLYYELGGSSQNHFFFTFKDDGSGWMRPVAEHLIDTHFIIKDIYKKKINQSMSNLALIKKKLLFLSSLLL